MSEGLGHNEDRKVFCHLCTWSKECGSMESIEFHFKRHLEEVHHLPLLYRTDSETGKRTELPQ